MDIRLDHTAVRLGRTDTISIVDGIGARVAALDGSVWITQERDRRDIVLERGQVFVVDRAGTTIIEALTDAEVAIDAPSDCVDLQPAQRDSNLTSLAILGYSRRAHRARVDRLAA